MRPVSPTIIANMASGRIPQARATFRNVLPRFGDHNSALLAIDGPIWPDFTGYDADTNGAMVHRCVQLDSGELKVMRLTSFEAPESWETLVAAGINGLKPAVHGARVFYQQGGVVKYQDWNGAAYSGAVTIVDKGATQVAIAPVASDKLYLYELDASGFAVITYCWYDVTWQSSTWGGRLFDVEGADARNFEAVEIALGCHCLYVSTLNEKNACYLRHDYGVWGELRPLVPIDIVDDFEYVKLASAATINGRCVVTVAIGREGLADPLLAYLVGPYEFTKGREMFVNSYPQADQGFPWYGKMHLVGTKLWCVGLGFSFEADATNLFGCDNPALKVTTTRIADLSITYTENSPDILSFDVGSSEASIRTGAEVTLEFGYNGEYTQLGVFAIENVIESKEEGGQAVHVVARSNAMQRLATWYPDVDAELYSSVVAGPDPSDQTQFIRYGSWVASGGISSGERVDGAFLVGGSRPARNWLVRSNMRWSSYPNPMDCGPMSHFQIYNAQKIGLGWGYYYQSGNKQGPMRLVNSTATFLSPSSAYTFQSNVDTWKAFMSIEGQFEAARLSGTSWAVSRGTMGLTASPWPDGTGLCKAGWMARPMQYCYGGAESTILTGVLSSWNSWIPVSTVSWMNVNDWVTAVDPTGRVVETIRISGLINTPALPAPRQTYAWADFYDGKLHGFPGAIYPGLNQPHPNSAQEPFDEANYQAVWFYAYNADSPPYDLKNAYRGLIMASSIGTIAEVGYFDAAAPSQWQDFPDLPGWHIGDPNDGAWNWNMRRLWLKHLYGPPIGQQNSATYIDWGDGWGSQPYFGNYPNYLATWWRMAHAVKFSSHGSLTAGWKITNTGSFASPYITYLQAISTDFDLRLVDAVRKVAKMAGVDIVYDREIGSSLSFANAGWDLPADFTATSRERAECIIKARVSSGMGSFGIGTSDVNGDGCMVTITGSTVDLYDIDVTSGAMALIESWPTGMTDPAGWWTVSLRKEWGLVWLNDRMVTAFHLGNTNGKTHAFIASDGALTLDLDWAELDMRIDDVLIDMSSSGLQNIKTIIDPRRIYLRDTCDGRLYIGYGKELVDAAEYTLAASSTRVDDISSLFTRARVVGIDEREAFHLETLKQRGNLYRYINIPEIDTAEELLLEARRLLDDSANSITQHALSGPFDPRPQVNDYYKVSVLIDGSMAVKTVQPKQIAVKISGSESQAQAEMRLSSCWEVA